MLGEGTGAAANGRIQMAHDPVVAETTRVRDSLEPRFVLADQEERAAAALARFRGGANSGPTC